MMQNSRALDYRNNDNITPLAGKIEFQLNIG